MEKDFKEENIQISKENLIKLINYLEKRHRIFNLANFDNTQRGFYDIFYHPDYKSIAQKYVKGPVCEDILNRTTGKKKKTNDNNEKIKEEKEESLKRTKFFRLKKNFMILLQEKLVEV